MNLPPLRKSPQEQKQGEIEPKLPYESLTKQTLQLFEDISLHPEKLGNPLRLGEVLFYNGYLKQAAICYQQALRRSNIDEDSSARDKAWILFQIGNCLRTDEPLKAMERYKQLITEYPESPWTDLAKAKSKLIDWYLKDKPKELINEYKL